MNELDSKKCPMCKGHGRVKLSAPAKKCLDSIRRLGNPTIAELHEDSGGNNQHTATNKRVARLIKAGLVRATKENGSWRRVEVV